MSFNYLLCKFINVLYLAHVLWVPVTMMWRVLGLWMEETASRYGG